MRNTHRSRRPLAAESIARMADKGGDVSRFFANEGRMVCPPQIVQVEFPPELLSELDVTAAELQLSREAAIRVLVRQALDAHYLARKARRTG
jgi:hypothetical protein